MSSTPLRHATPSVDDLVSAVGRSARAEAEAERRRPPPGAMVLPRPDGRHRWLIIATLLLMVVVAAGTGGFAWYFRAAVEVGGDAYRRVVKPEVEPLPPPEVLADEQRFYAVVEQRPRERSALLHARLRTLITMGAGSATAALATWAELERMGTAQPSAQLDYAFALTLSGQKSAAHEAALAIPAQALDAADRATLTALIERLVLRR